MCVMHACGLAYVSCVLAWSVCVCGVCVFVFVCVRANACMQRLWCATVQAFVHACVRFVQVCIRVWCVCVCLLGVCECVLVRLFSAVAVCLK